MTFKTIITNTEKLKVPVPITKQQRNQLERSIVLELTSGNHKVFDTYGHLVRQDINLESVTNYILAGLNKHVREGLDANDKKWKFK